MPRRERKTLQISKEAFRVLEKATENTNLSYRDLIDSLTGAVSSPEKPDTTDWVGYLREAAAEAALERKDEVSEANEDLMSARLGISGDSVESIRKKYNPVEKPDAAIIDAAILYSWSADELGSIEKQLEKVDADYAAKVTKLDIKWLRSRANIKKIVIWKMENGWSDLFPDWWADHQKNLSYFERTLASRLSALVKANLIISYATGVYRLSPMLADNIEQAGKYWSIINGVNAIPANPSMKLFKTRSGIKNLLGIE
tara:strand:- start:589 stop:1359 length:771 start_codon:yes stop_codon:yes gene_type:complete